MAEKFTSFLDELAQDPGFSRSLAAAFQSQKHLGPEQHQSSADRSDFADTGEPGTRTKRKDSSSKRNKYIPRACQDCQRRKVKCSGETVCYHCRARNVQCVYLPKSEVDGRRKRNKVSSPRSDPSKPDNASSRVAKSPNSTSKDISLESRVAMLQEQIRGFTEGSTSKSERQRWTFTSSTLYTVDLAAENGDDTDTFNNGTGTNNLSLSAQLADLQNLLHLPRRAPQQNWNRVFALELPHPVRLQYLLNVYFAEMDSFFPLLDQQDAEARLISTLTALGYSDCNLIVDVDTAHYPAIAMLCSMLVLGECQDPEIKGCDDPKPGWAMYHRSRKLIQHCGNFRTLDLDLIRYHTLSALYMMNSELLQSAAHAISTAIQLSMAARLNDQSLWGECTPLEKQSRQRLWWTIYFLDRRIAQRNGTPYIVRDIEAAVDEFAGPESMRRPSKEKLASEEKGNADVMASNYLQSLVNFGRLWGEIWDSFYAAATKKNKDWRDIALADTRILIFRRMLPAELTWDTEQVMVYLAEGETEPRLRRRLAIYLRANLLRMIIRQNPILSCDGDKEARYDCAQFARNSIDAIAVYASACPTPRASGYFISTALVECIYHLVYILQDETLQIDRPSILDAFRKAYQLLQDFAQNWVTAKRAVQALSVAIFSGGNANDLLGAIKNSKNEPSECSHDFARDGEFDLSTCNVSPGGLFEDFMLDTSSLDLGLPPNFMLDIPTMNDLSGHILRDESRRLAQQGFGGNSESTQCPKDGFNDANLGGDRMFQ